MIFPHPEKRLVELSPEGPVSVAFWRWTIRPTNDTSAIIEPIAFDFYDTRNRVPRSVTISAQRVAYDESTLPAARAPAAPAELHPLAVWIAAGSAAVLGLALTLAGRRFGGWQALRRLPPFDPARRGLRAAARRGDLAELRRAAARLMRRDGARPGQGALLAQLDRAIFDPKAGGFDARGFAKSFLGTRRETDTIG